MKVIKTEHTSVMHVHLFVFVCLFLFFSKVCVCVCVCMCVFVCVRARGHVPTINAIAAWLLCVQVTCYAPLCARTGKYTRTLTRIKKKLTRTQKRLAKH